jgi:hypothetical protein
MFGKALSRFLNTASIGLGRIFNKARSLGAVAPLTSLRGSYSSESPVTSHDILSLFNTNRDSARQLAFE